MATRDLVDRILGGRLDAELAERKDNGDTFDEIARWLEDTHDIKVSRETVRNWYNERPTESEAAAS